ncbi:MAG: hypothetical protein AAFQ47_03405 [Pseudomonadota bacterium]
MKAGQRNSYVTGLRKVLHAVSFGRLRFPGLLFCTALSVCLVFGAGLLRPSLASEDGPIENASAILFLFGSLMGTWHLLAPYRISALDRGLILTTTLLSLLFFLSEISFGARYFDLEMPKMEGGGEFDGGHDIVIVVFRLLMKGGPTSALIAVGLMLLLIGALVLVYRLRAPLRRFLKDAFHFALAVLFALLASAVLLDLHPSRTVSKLEEALELTAAFVVVWAFFVVRRG